jgi:two-component system sensor histidine kinase/response regulator
MTEKTPAIDVEDVLERVQDDKQLLVELLGIFEKDYQDKRKTLGRLVKQSDFDKIKDIIHSVKGASGNISAKAMFASCAKIEELAAKKDIVSIGKLLDTLDKQFVEMQQHAVSIRNEFGNS